MRAKSTTSIEQQTPYPPTLRTPGTQPRRLTSRCFSLTWVILAASLPFITCHLAPPPASAQETPATATADSLIIALAIDTSRTIHQADHELIRVLAISVLKELPSGSQVTVFGFDDEPIKLAEGVSDPASLDDRLRNLHPGGNHTALYDATHEIVRFLGQSKSRRRVGIIASDGREENSAVTLEDGVRDAVDAGIPIFTIGIGNIKDQDLRRIARLTNGRYYSITLAQASALAQAIQIETSRQKPEDTNKTPVLTPSPPTEPPQEKQPVTENSSAPEDTQESSPFRNPLFWILAVLFITLLGITVTLIVRHFSQDFPPPRQALSPLTPCLKCGYLHVSGAACPQCGHGEPSPGTRPSGTIVSPHPLPNPALEVSADNLPVSTLPIEETVRIVASASFLRIREGNGVGSIFQLPFDSPTIIGRGPTATIKLSEDLAVSQTHCQIDFFQGCFSIRDLTSMNGTYRNGKNIQHLPEVLLTGDVIQIGQTYFEFTAI